MGRVGGRSMVVLAEGYYRDLTGLNWNGSECMVNVFVILMIVKVWEIFF